MSRRVRVEDLPKPQYQHHIGRARGRAGIPPKWARRFLPFNVIAIEGGIL